MNQNEKKWNIAYDCSDEENNQIIKLLMAQLGLSRLSAVALLNRGYRDIASAESFIRNETVLLHDPFLLPDMENAARIIIDAIEKQEHICVYGDYDADGVTSTCVLYSYLSSKNADVSYYIPDRKTEGYGMNIASVERMAGEGIKLIVTVDNGITAVNEIARAKELGMRVVVTDHHSCHDVLPPSDASVDPWIPGSQYPFCELAGVGVAFKTICAIETLLCENDGREVPDAIKELCMRYTDLVAIGTVADVMPIRDENRLLCAMGLYLLKNNPSLGVDALIYAASLGDTVSAASPDYYVSRPRETNKRKINASFISFVLAPRINAAGRVTHAFDAVDLFLSEDKKEAMRAAIHLCEVNTKRKSLENVIAEAVVADIERQGKPQHKIIVLSSDDWQNGVVGIVASRITEKYGLPVILVSFEDSMIDGCPSPMDMGKGSCRSIPGFDIHAALDSCADLFVRYGGHELAAGLTVYRKDFDEFVRRVSEYADATLDLTKTQISIDIDCVADLSELTLESASELAEFEPYGSGNPQPVFATYDAKVRQIQSLSHGKYAKLVIEENGTTQSALCFVCSYDDLPVYIGERADVAYNLDINEYKGISTPQLGLKDIRLSSSYSEWLSSSLSLVERFIGGEDVIFPGGFVPERKDLAVVYNYIKQTCSQGFSSFSLRKAASSIRENGYTSFEVWQVALITEIFAELGLVISQKMTEDIRSISIPDPTKKADLQNSRLLNRYMELHKPN